MEIFSIQQDSFGKVVGRQQTIKYFITFEKWRQIGIYCDRTHSCILSNGNFQKETWYANK